MARIKSTVRLIQDIDHEVLEENSAEEEVNVDNFTDEGGVESLAGTSREVPIPKMRVAVRASDMAMRMSLVRKKTLRLAQVRLLKTGC